MISKKITVPLITLSLVATTVFTAPPVYAQDTTAGRQNFFYSIFHKIMRKFGFEKTQQNSENVQTQMGQDDQAPPTGATGDRPNGTPQGARQTDEERLAELVTAGKITETQKTAILAEIKTVRAKYMSTPSTTPDPSKKDGIAENMKLMNAELTAWAKAQGIDMSYVLFQPQGEGPDGKGASNNMKKPADSLQPTSAE